MAAEPPQPINEFEREPVPRRALLGFKSFLGMYAGEHCAGTELMIGPLFVAGGVSAFDLVVGLLLGNLLAVLSWMLLCAPIATRARLTLYYQLERICGRNLVVLYNLANGVMFCFLAGAMITVSATAVGVWADFPMPSLDDIYPNSVGWVLAVLGVGAAISVVAAYGYQTVSRFANIASPWMVLVFLAFGIIALANFISTTGVEIRSPGDLWHLAQDEIWKGGPPLEGKDKLTFWHVTFFAWFCNMAMHIGMSDLTVFRYAKRSWYAIASAAGMYVGHFMAWISASLLYAHQLHLDPTNEDVLPGPMAYQAAGVAGLLCVIIAGWTTANPTIYRAGLAFQAIMPKRSRFAVTLLTGAVATLAGMFPGIAMKLLGFVMLYGMLLMPMGAVVFVDFYWMRKFRLRSEYALHSGTPFNWAAGLTWFLTLAFCLVVVNLDMQGIMAFVEDHGLWTFGERSRAFFSQANQIYFVSLPGWFVAAGMYLILSRFHQRRQHEGADPPATSRFSMPSPDPAPQETVRGEDAADRPHPWPAWHAAARVIAWLAILGIVLPPLAYLAGKVELDHVKLAMLIATLVWFVAAPLATVRRKAG